MVRKPKVCFTIDLEQDCPPYFSSYEGMEKGLPKLLALLRSQKVPSTFFATGEVARKYPDLMRQIIEEGHELGCHGDTHRRFDAMTEKEAAEEIRNSTETLRRFYPVVSFRAPNLSFPLHYLKLLEEQEYKLDSSHAKYKLSQRWQRQIPTGLKRIPASVTSSVLRLPFWIRKTLFRWLADPVVLFVHPWEFVDWRQTALRFDCRFKTGEIALECMRENFSYFKGRGVRFLKMQELLLVE